MCMLCHYVPERDMVCAVFVYMRRIASLCAIRLSLWVSACLSTYWRDFGCSGIASYF